MNEHAKTHNRVIGDPFYCQYCSKQLKTKKILNRHLRIQHRDERRRDVGDEKFSGLVQCRVHSRTRGEVMPFSRCQCDLKNDQYQILKKITKKEEPYVCFECCQGFAEDYHLAYHIKENHLTEAATFLWCIKGEETKPYSCAMK